MAVVYESEILPEDLVEDGSAVVDQPTGHRDFKVVHGENEKVKPEKRDYDKNILRGIGALVNGRVISYWVDNAEEQLFETSDGTPKTIWKGLLLNYRLEEDWYLPAYHQREWKIDDYSSKPDHDTLCALGLEAIGKTEARDWQHLVLVKPGGVETSVFLG